jgi:hypothetical protein
MGRGHPILQRLCPLSPWVGQQWPQIMAPWLVDVHHPVFCLCHAVRLCTSILDHIIIICKSFLIVCIGCSLISYSLPKT